ncbi:hypothetical protein Bra3105_13515 [Brachybacterium halotolerans subsp. kimchii]|uniref:hypothetical protein n=1 Tax=Brachybacterium halotolerans TaxID=2795215 RepID=UPI001E3A3741|nr:hypothetical protein [Brachybacterium halotolerans]UEJ81855.1 hypothetical protein Bra3105_13515 [Brachybacterium halotolerans subsp. kimchii]
MTTSSERATELCSRIDEALPAECSTQPMTTVPAALQHALLVLEEAVHGESAIPALPASTLLLTRMRAVVDVSMPVAPDVLDFYRRCMRVLHDAHEVGAIETDELAALLLELELTEERATGLCPSLQWSIPSDALARALAARLTALAEKAFEELMNYSDVAVEVDGALTRRWHRVHRMRAELAFARQDLEELGRVLSRWGGAPYGEFMYRAAWHSPPADLLPVALSAARAGQITHVPWSAQVRTSESVLSADEARPHTPGMRHGVPIASDRPSPLRHASLHLLIRALDQAGQRQAARNALQEQFRRCPAPEAVPALHTWWKRLEIEEDAVGWARSVMLTGPCST